MSKFIIENKSDLNDEIVMQFVLKVIVKGRISNKGKQYCYVSIFTFDGKQYSVVTHLNKNSDRFVICNHNLHGEKEYG